MSMSLNMRRAAISELAPISELNDQDSETCIAFLFGMPPFEPDNKDTIMAFFGLWHVAHFVFSGTEWERNLPSGFILGGDYWLQWDKETEPMTILSPEMVKKVADYLRELDDTTVEARYKQLLAGQTEIYHGDFSEAELDLVKVEVTKLHTFVGLAAQQGHAIVKEVG